MSQTFRTLAALPILLLILLLGSSRNVSPGEEAPDFTLQDTHGTELSLASTKGRIVALVFWRAGQERSMEALTVLQSIYTEFKQQDIMVLALSSDEGGPELISKTKQSKQLTFPMLYDKGKKAYGDYGVFAVPTTFIIDKEGGVNYYYPGYRDDFPRQIHGRIEVLLGQKTLEELEAELKPIEKAQLSESEKKAARYLQAGNRLLEKGMVRPAMTQYQKAVQEKPDLFEPHLHLGNIYLTQEKIEEAAAEFKQAMELKPRSAEAYAGLGDALFLQGQLEEAVKMLQASLKLNPKLAKAHYVLGEIYEQQKRIDDALREYKTALKILLGVEE
jgi:peroxiredoxin/Tfp pilus assembly protein PilF